MNARTQRDIEGMQAAGRAVRRAFDAMRAAAEPGITTAELDAIGASVLKANGARSAPILFYEFPGHTCISVNEEAAHGIPGPRVLAQGDIVNIDVSAQRDGYVADMGQSFVVGDGAPERHAICVAVESAVLAAIEQIRPGRNLNVIGETVQRMAEAGGYGIVANLGSHGVGRSIHEAPSYIPVDNPRERRKLKRGLVFTIEPFFTNGPTWVNEQPDGWTLSVPRGCLVAQFEHTVLVTQDGARIITAATN